MPKAHVESIRRSLVSLRRLFQRRELVELWETAFGAATRMDYAELKLLDAVRVAYPPTVGQVSRLLGVDPSRASRQVARAVARGLLMRRAEQGDARKVLLEVTPAGVELQERGSALTRARIALALEGFSAVDRARFAAMFGQFVDRITWPGKVGLDARAHALPHVQRRSRRLRSRPRRG